MKISLRTQIDSVTLSLMGKKNHLETLRRLVSKKQRPETDITIIQASIPGLEAAVKTLEWLEKNETKIKEALKK